MSSSLILIHLTDMKFDHVWSVFRNGKKKDKKLYLGDKQEEQVSYLA